MNVRFLKEHEVKLCDRRTKIYPVGWTGEIDDDVAEKAIKAKKAELVAVDDGSTTGVDDKKSDGKKTDSKSSK